MSNLYHEIFITSGFSFRWTLLGRDLQNPKFSKRHGGNLEILESAFVFLNLLNSIRIQHSWSRFLFVYIGHRRGCRCRYPHSRTCPTRLRFASTEPYHESFACALCFTFGSRSTTGIFSLVFFPSEAERRASLRILVLSWICTLGGLSDPSGFCPATNCHPSTRTSICCNSRLHEAGGFVLVQCIVVGRVLLAVGRWGFV